jgi:phage N-6-adenine-methyltransferase
MNNAVMFSSATDEWETPQDFFESLRWEFKFGLDVAARGENAKCLEYIGTDRDDARFRDALAIGWRETLDFTWGDWHRACWMNPPYSKGLQGKFIAKAAEERLRGVLTVALLPARTDTKAFHTHIYDASKWQPRDGIEIRFIPGRLKFGGAAHSAPFPSMVVIFRP